MHFILVFGHLFKLFIKVKKRPAFSIKNNIKQGWCFIVYFLFLSSAYLSAQSWPVLGISNSQQHRKQCSRDRDLHRYKYHNPKRCNPDICFWPLDKASPLGASMAEFMEFRWIWARWVIFIMEFKNNSNYLLRLIPMREAVTSLFGRELFARAMPWLIITSPLSWRLLILRMFQLSGLWKLMGMRRSTSFLGRLQLWNFLRIQ